MASPCLSIITINKNNQQGLIKTINSVISQSFKSFEFIIIDGNSTDGSIAIINQFSDHVTFWLSEPDSGIYNAMNKGIKEAQGHFCLFLNSGDWLKSETSLDAFFSHNPQSDIVAGDIIFYDTVRDNIKWVVKSPVKLTAKTLFWGTLPHQATLIKRDLFYKYGFYREDLKIASDWSFFLDVLFQYNCTYQYIPVTLSYFAMDGISCNAKTKGLPIKEQETVLIEKYPRFIDDYQKLRELENLETKWIESRAYRVYKKLSALGIINLGIQFTRVKDFIFRFLRSK